MGVTRDGLFECTLRKRRIKFGYSNQRDFAKIVGVSESQVYRWENGYTYPSVPAIMKIERLLQCRLADIYKPLK